jgi:hypothetical protein
VGGDLVVITGSNIPGDVQVRIGDSGLAPILGASSSASGSALLIRTPALVAGSYDVTVYDASHSVGLHNALTYIDPGTGDPGTGDPGTGDPGTGNPGTQPTSNPTSPSNPGTGNPTNPGPSNPTTNPTTTPTTNPTSPPGDGSNPPPSGGNRITGRYGESLVDDATMSGLLGAGVWNSSCRTSCTGTQV